MLSPITCSSEHHSVGGNGRFILSDCEAAATRLLESAEGSVELIYLDPPFGTGEQFMLKTGKKSSTIAIPAYSDKLDRDEYLAVMERVLTLCHSLLAPDGSIYLHVDYRMAPYLRILLDKIFGPANFMNEIVWAYKTGGRAKNHFSRKHDNILFYRKSRAVFFNIEAVGIQRGPQRRNHMKRHVSEDGVVTFSIKSGNKVYTYPETSLVFPSDVWDDIEHLHQRDPERTGYATQKPVALLTRIIAASSPATGTVVDFYAGSGTSAVAASRLGRKWLSVDSSPVSLMSVRNRFLGETMNVTLFNNSGNVTFEYPDLINSPELAQSVEATKADDRLEVQFSAPLAYAALGKIENGVFYPGPRIVNPLVGDKLAGDSSVSGSVLQLVATDGRQLFAEYSD